MRDLISLLGVVALASGCSLVLEDGIGNFRTSLNGKRDVRVTMLDLDPHLDQFMDFQVIVPPPDDQPMAAPVMEARAVIVGLPVSCFELNWPLGASLAATRLDFYADLDGNGILSGPGDDHVWRRELTTEAGGVGVHRFIHDVRFDDVRSSLATTTGVDLDIALTGIDAQDGQRGVVAVIRDFRDTLDLQQESVPAIGVVGRVDGGIMNITIAGLLDAGSPHRIEIDFGDGALTCRGEFTAPASGALVINSLDAPFDCTVTDRHEVFRDVSDTMCR